MDENKQNQSKKQKKDEWVKSDIMPDGWKPIAVRGDQEGCNAKWI
jgi:hypothetical protein